MDCENCKKKKAVIHYTEVIDGKIRKVNLCEDCAKSKGIGIQPPFSIGDLLGGLAPHIVESNLETGSLTCSECGMTLLIFKKTGRLGCGACYEVFKTNMIPILSSIHKATRHVGKIPSKEKKAVGVISKVRELELKLQDAIKKEEFEIAAEIRDQIKAMENKRKGRGKE